MIDIYFIISMVVAALGAIYICDTFTDLNTGLILLYCFLWGIISSIIIFIIERRNKK